MKRVLIPLLLSLGLVAALAAPAFAWQFGVVDTNDRDSQGTSLAIDRNAKVYVAWEENGGDDLWWGNWNGTSWSKTQILGKNTFLACYGDNQGLGVPDYGPSAGFRPDNGKARIASACAVDIPGQNVYWTYKASNGTWVSDVVGSLSGPVTNVDLAFEPTSSYGNIVVGDRRDADVTWIHWNGTMWVQDVIEQGTGGFGIAGPLVSIAFNPVTDEPSVVWTYRDNASSLLTYASYDSGSKSWSKSSIATDAMGVPSLAFAPDGTPWVAFQEGTATASHLEVANKLGASWSLTSVDSGAAVTGVAPSAAFTGSKLRVAYYDQTNGNLRWASLGTAWSLKTLEATNNVGDRPCLGFNASGGAYVSYHDTTKKDIRWARPS